MISSTHDILRVRGGRRLHGTLPVAGSKNAALPLLACALLTDQEVHIENVPDIHDVARMIALIRSLGVEIERTGGTVRVHAHSLDLSNFDETITGLLRASVLLMAPLAVRSTHFRLPPPGGDIIGARPLDVHENVLRAFGLDLSHDDQCLVIDGKPTAAGDIVLPEFSVTATESALMIAAATPGRTVIYTAAAEPHVQNLADFLQQMGATISGHGTHTIVIDGSQKLHGGRITVIPDDIEAGTFAILAAATGSDLMIHPVIEAHSRLMLNKLREIGVRWELDGTTLHVWRAQHLRAMKVQSLPAPGIPTDLQAPFAVLATQAHGTSLIHDPMYESRFGYLEELIKMGANAVKCDPHRALITGPTHLRGREVKSFDIRAGATLLIAGLVAEGETILHEVDQLDRGYAQLDRRLNAVGADITRIAVPLQERIPDAV